MKKKRDIQTVKEIEIFVDTFYSSVRNDDLLGSIFSDSIGDNWPSHLRKMYTYWENVLLYNYKPSDSKYSSHSDMLLSKIHYDRWIQLFEETVDQNFEGPIAEKALQKARKMIEIYSFKSAYYKGNF